MHWVIECQKQSSFFFVPAGHALREQLGADESLDRLIALTDGYYTLVQTETGYALNDLRFGQLGGWLDGHAPFVFSYAITPLVGGGMRIEQRKNQMADGGAVARELFERLNGL